MRAECAVQNQKAKDSETEEISMTMQQPSTRFAACVLTVPVSLMAQTPPTSAARPNITSAPADFSMNPVPMTIGDSAFGSSKPTVTVDLQPAAVISYTGTPIVVN